MTVSGGGDEVVLSKDRKNGSDSRSTKNEARDNYEGSGEKTRSWRCGTEMDGDSRLAEGENFPIFRGYWDKGGISLHIGK